MSILANLLVKVTGDSSGLETAMDRGTRKMRGFSRDAERLLSSRLTQALSLTALTVGINKAFRAADEFEASQRKLAATAKITGQNLGFLQVTAQEANRQFGLGTRLANEYAIEVTKLTSKAGQIEQTGEAIGALLNLGAGRGFNATQTLEAVRQAILGIDEGTDKLFGKNPSVIYAEFARQVGISAGKMSDGEKALALLSAAMNDGGKVAGQYADFLASPAGKTEQLRIATEEAAVRIGRAFQAVRVAVLPVLSDLAVGFSKTIRAIQVAGADMAVIAAEIRAALAGIWHGQGSEQQKEANRWLSRIRSAARAEIEKIEKEFALSSEITGPSNPIVTMMNNVVTATESATEAAKRLSTELDRAMRKREFTMAKRGSVTPDNMAGRSALQRLRGGLPGMIDSVTTRSTPAPITANAGSGGFLSQFASGIGSQIMDVVKQFGPLAAAAAVLKPVFEGLMEVLGPVLETLAEPLRTIGRLIGASFAPALKLLQPILDAVAWAFSYVTEGIGRFLVAIGKAINFLLPGNPANGLVRWGQEMIDAAKAARKGTEATNQFAESLSNAARVFSVARARHSVVTGGGAGLGPGGIPPISPPRHPTNPPVTVNFYGPVMDPSQVTEAVGRAVDRAGMRMGTTRLNAAFT